MAEPRAYHTKGSKLERESQIPYNITYTKPKISHTKNISMKQNRLTVTYIRLVVAKVQRGREGKDWEFRNSKYKLLCIG